MARIDNLGDYNIVRDALHARGGNAARLFREIGESAVAKERPAILKEGAGYATLVILAFEAVVFLGIKGYHILSQKNGDKERDQREDMLREELESLQMQYDEVEERVKQAFAECHDLEQKIELNGILTTSKMSNEERHRRCQDVFDAVSFVTGISVEDILSRKRTTETVRARQLVMYFCREYSDMSLEEIAKALGKHDHTTVMSGIGYVKSELHRNYELKRVVDAIDSMLVEREGEEVDSHEET